jgi:hypothetical protein
MDNPDVLSHATDTDKTTASVATALVETKVPATETAVAA